MVTDCDARVYRWRVSPESISAQSIHRLQVNISARNAGPNKHGIADYVSAVRLVGLNIEVEIIPKRRIDPVAVPAPLAPSFEEENVVLEE